MRGERRGMVGTLRTPLIILEPGTGVGIIAGDGGPLPLPPAPRCGPRQSLAAYRGAFVLWTRPAATSTGTNYLSRISCSLASALPPEWNNPGTPLVSAVWWPANLASARIFSLAYKERAWR